MNNTAKTKETIDTLDLRNVITKLTATPERGGYNWPEKEAKMVEKKYRTFLKEIAGLYTVPSKEGFEGIEPSSIPVDIFWHTHILFTRKYKDDCQKIFGRFLHHDPQLAAVHGLSS